MVLLHLFTLLLLAGVHCQPHKRQADENTAGEEECCDQKMVGDDRYFNIGYDHNGITWDLNCLSPCIFEKEDQPGSKYCFASGDMKVECEDDMDFTPTGGPRPTGGATEDGVTGDGGPDGTTEDGGPDGGDGLTTEAGGPGGSNGTCRCGIKKTQRIVGGSEAEVNEYPWIAIFGDSNGDNLGGCSSTLIGNNWALTAAHCFFNPDTNQQDKFKDDLTVVLGIHDRTIVVTPDTPLSERKVLKISEIVLHPDYNQATSSSNDIALLKFTESVELEKYSPACLAEKDADFSSGAGWVYGWGVTSENGADLAEKLQELEVPIVSDAVCRSAMEGQGVTITEDMLCAGGQEGKDSCGGDSGGPFTVAADGIHTLAGVVSFGIGCARDGLYGVYAEVAMFRGWIDETIREKDASAVFCN